MHLSSRNIFNTEVKGENWVELSQKQLKSLHNVCTMIAKDIFDFCERNNISVYLCGGSALGAVRHQGFIPWDDDMDLSMPREDFNRFIETFSKEYEDKYWFHSPDYSKHIDRYMSRVLLKGTVSQDFTEKNLDECGIFVDIFPIENTFNNYFLRMIHGWGCLMFTGIVSCRRYNKIYKYILPMVSNNEKARKSLKVRAALGWLVSFWPLEKWVQAANRWYKICKDNSSKYVTIPTGSKWFFGEMFERETYLKETKMSFENYLWPVTADYRNYLTRLYGDYMTLPPPEKREHHLLLEFDLGKYENIG